MTQRTKDTAVRGLLWDLDNTLMDFPSAEAGALRDAFADFRLGPCPPDRVARFSALNAKYWGMLERGEVAREELLTGRFRVFFQKEGIACTDYAGFNAAYQGHLGETVVYLDDSYALIRRLHGRVKQFLVTNGSRSVQERKLRSSGLGALMDGVFISEVVGAEKPDPAFFAPVLAAAAPLKREELLLVGDSLTSDMEGGRRAGIPCAWYNPKGAPVPAGMPIRYDLRNLWELLPLIE